jgi:HK97 family phage major capsid protein
MAQMTKEQLDETIADVAGKSVDERLESAVEKLAASFSEQLKAMQAEKKDIHVGEERETLDPKAGFKSLAEFAHVVAVYDKSRGRNADERLLTLEKIDKAAGTSMNESANEYGGHLVPTEFRRELLEVALDKSDFMSRATKIPMATNSVDIPYIDGFDHSSGYVHGAVMFYWLDEEAAKTESRMKFGKITLKLNKVAGLAYTSDEILEDSYISMEPLLRKGFSDGLAWTMDDVLINGTGAGQPLGILAANCTVSVSGETGQDADTVKYQNILNMYARLYRKGSGNAIWIVNDAVLPQLAEMAIPVGTGGVPVFLPAYGASGRPYNTILGLPVVFNEHAAALGDAGDVILADFSQYLIGQKNAGPKFDTSIHLKFDYDQTAFRFVYRVDGAPWWPSALTPHKATTSTLSPFVALAAI